LNFFPIFERDVRIRGAFGLGGWKYILGIFFFASFLVGLAIVFFYAISVLVFPFSPPSDALPAVLPLAVIPPVVVLLGYLVLAGSRSQLCQRGSLTQAGIVPAAVALSGLTVLGPCCFLSMLLVKFPRH